MEELYGRYHGRILVLAARSTEDGGWKAKLREILAEFDDDCRELSASESQLLRHELASQEREEIAIIASYLPQQMSEVEMRQALAGVIQQTGAVGLKDIGKVMAALKQAYAGKMDFAKAGGLVKGQLGS